MHTVNVHEAKARLSEVLAAVEAGETVVIARRNKPIAKLVPIAADELPRLPRPIGLARGMGTVGAAFHAPLTDEELAGWDGQALSALRPETLTAEPLGQK